MLSELYSMQEELDARIFELHNVTRESTQKDRVLALAVEVSELANETRSFKYWSVKDETNRQAILEEYSDGIHFLLSLGIDIGKPAVKYPEHESKLDLTGLFLDVYRSIGVIQHVMTVEVYNSLVMSYLQIAIKLGISEEEIIEQYHLKNKKNHQRQDDGY